jgi:hypothetical protein
VTQPPIPPADPRVEHRVNELVLGLLLAPFCVIGAQLIQVGLHHGANFASTRGAMAMLAGPSLFGAGLFALLRMHWAAWAAWGIDVLLFGLVGAGDMVVGGVLSARLVVAVVLLPLLAWRIAGLQRMQSLNPPPGRG